MARKRETLPELDEPDFTEIGAGYAIGRSEATLRSLLDIRPGRPLREQGTAVQRFPL